METKNIVITPFQLSALILVNLAVSEIIETSTVNEDVIEELKELNPIIADLVFNTDDYTKKSPCA